MYVRSLVAASTKPSVSSLLAKPCGSLFSGKLASSFNGGVYSSWTPLRLFSGKTIDIPLPPLAESMDSGTLASWEKKVGDFCKVDETIAIVDTDKVSVDVRAPASGELSEQIAKQGDEIKVGDIIARLIPGSSASGSSKKEESAVKPSSPEISKKESPEPKKAVTLEKEVKPVKETEKESSPKKLDSPSSSQPSVPQVLMSGRTTKVVKMTPMRKKTAERLKDSQNTAASLTTFNEIDMSNLINMRNLYKDDFLKKHGVKLGFMSCFAAAAVAALKELPVVNGRIDAQQENIIYHDYIDLSVAVSSPRGLVVPVIRDVQNMTFLNIETEVMNLANKAKDNKLTLEEMSGGTFTITNGGVFGSMMSTPMINMPQSAILGMHAVKERAVVINGEIKVRPMMYVALTYDHRIIDGRESVTFLKSIKEKIEDPHRLLLNL